MISNKLKSVKAKKRRIHFKTFLWYLCPQSPCCWYTSYFSLSPLWRHSVWAMWYKQVTTWLGRERHQFPISDYYTPYARSCDVVSGWFSALGEESLSAIFAFVWLQGVWVLKKIIYIIRFQRHWTIYYFWRFSRRANQCVRIEKWISNEVTYQYKSFVCTGNLDLYRSIVKVYKNPDKWSCQN